ncbi:MAG TPA: isoprenylcysteine carboxylmethyltransferase family protein [Casimicrobiaceae bacterium]|nr:isoprenylcysteine carboxylmethyltransferase family protein [Casimicrobiaceae bacterium]
MSALELKIPPPIVALLIGGAMWFGVRQGPALELPALVRAAAFAAIALLGGAIAFAGNIAFRRARTTVNPFRPQNATALVTSGVFRFTRNPMYLGLAFLVLGWAVFLCSPWALAGPVVFVLYVDRFQIKPEEKILSAKFGAAYAEYAARVRRWL